jgi:hypothetical protein
MRDDTTAPLITLVFVGILTTAIVVCIALVQVFTDGLFG